MTEVEQLALSYILPVKQDRSFDLEFQAYLRELNELLELIIVDGSTEAWFLEHKKGSGSFVHVALDPDLRAPNGKVWGVLTALPLATHDKVIVADDDVRYGREELIRVMELLDVAEVVRPQNYFSPAPWHAQWDSSRSLLNRVFGGDWPGTLGFRRSFLAKGYNGSCLFENLEMVRTIRAAGGRELVAGNLYVLRRPCSTRHFLAQRIRQAYDEWARPGRFALQLALLPAALLSFKRGPRFGVSLAAGAVLLAELGRQRDGASTYFSPLASLMAPFWLLERMVCAWLALGTRALRGGVNYNGGLIARAATPSSELEQRFAKRGSRMSGTPS